MKIACKFNVCRETLVGWRHLSEDLKVRKALLAGNLLSVECFVRRVAQPFGKKKQFFTFEAFKC